MEFRTGRQPGTMMTAQQEKHTFSQLLHKHGITMIALAREVGLPRTVLYALLMGQPVFVDQAYAVLSGLSKLTGATYTLQNVYLVLEPSRETARPREAVWQCPTQRLSAVKQPERTFQQKRRSIKGFLFGFLLGGGFQWQGSC